MAANKQTLLKKITDNPDMYEKAEAVAGEKELDSINELKVQDLLDIITEVETDNSDVKDKEEKAEIDSEKKWYMKDQFFGKGKHGVKKSKDRIPQPVRKSVNYYKLVVGREKFTFMRNVPLTDYQLSKFTNYQKNFYLELR